jgi:hypothetical protein
MGFKKLTIIALDRIAVRDSVLRYSQPPHLRDQSSSRQSKPACRAILPAHHPVRFLKRGDDVQPFSARKGSGGAEEAVLTP